MLFAKLLAAGLVRDALMIKWGTARGGFTLLGQHVRKP